MKKIKLFFALMLLIINTAGLKAQRNIEALVEQAIENAEYEQRLNGKYLVADLSKLSNLKIVPPEVVRKVAENRYKVRNIKTVKRLVFNKSKVHVTRFEFRDLALVRQDEIDAARAKVIRDSIRKVEAIAAAKYQDSMQRVRAELLVIKNENREKYLPGMWLSNVNEVIQIHEDGVIDMVQLEGEQLSVRLYWKFDPRNKRLLISNNQQDYTNLGRVAFSTLETVVLLRNDGKKFTMSQTSKAAIETHLRYKALARDIFNLFDMPRVNMTRDEEYIEFMHWRERGYQ